MGVRMAGARKAGPNGTGPPARWTCALVNNMPDAAFCAAECRPFEDIFSDPPDLLVVTGSNPIESRIEDEPYWSDLHGLLKWGSENVPAMVLSCLSAHGALAVFDGVERTTLPVKCTGVFAQEAD